MTITQCRTALDCATLYYMVWHSLTGCERVARYTNHYRWSSCHWTISWPAPFCLLSPGSLSVWNAIHCLCDPWYCHGGRRGLVTRGSHNPVAYPALRASHHHTRGDCPVCVGGLPLSASGKLFIDLVIDTVINGWCNYRLTHWSMVDIRLTHWSMVDILDWPTDQWYIRLMHWSMVNILGWHTDQWLTY